MFAPTRDQARRFFIATWAKYRAGAPLSGIEALTVELVHKHPEYQAVLEDEERYLDRDYLPEAGDVNPFLHLGLHLAVAEQLSIDQPPGIRAHYERLAAARGDEHAALHAIIDCLAEVVWRAQRDGTAPDGVLYLECLARSS
jgi:hypothetical protein